MSDKLKQLSNPFSSGGGGHGFENHVQSAFVVLMLTGGSVPCLSPLPITKIKLQGKYAGYNTDDFIAYLENQKGNQKAKLLAQIKHSVSITERDKTFGEVIQAAWGDFQNSELFDPNTDAIALISGPLSATDIESARVILEAARHSATAQEFLDKVNRAKFSSSAQRQKLQAFRAQLKKANKDKDLDDEQLWKFLKSFHLLGYDLDIKSGVTLSLLNSHIAQFNCGDILGVWAKIANEVASFNQNAGTITFETLSEEVKQAFRERVPIRQIPADLLKPDNTNQLTALNQSQMAALVFALLLGAWADKSPEDVEVIKKLIGRP